jgi:hypothetical protein
MRYPITYNLFIYFVIFILFLFYFDFTLLFYSSPKYLSSSVTELADPPPLYLCFHLTISFHLSSSIYFQSLLLLTFLYTVFIQFNKLCNIYTYHSSDTIYIN